MEKRPIRSEFANDGSGTESWKLLAATFEDLLSAVPVKI
jgi:hypothetical protein